MIARSTSHLVRNLNATRVTVPNRMEFSSRNRRPSEIMVESITDSEETDNISLGGDSAVYAREGHLIPTSYLPTG